MITIKNSRYNGGPEPHVNTLVRQTYDAFESLVASEIGFGTRIIELSDMYISTIGL